MNYTKRIGEITELRCRLDFVKRGIVLSQPINPDSRYDFIADIGGKIIRIQCKTCSLTSPNKIIVPLFNVEPYTQKQHRYNEHEVDYFYTNWNNNGYLLSLDMCKENKKSKTIRLSDKSEYQKHSSNDIYSSDVDIDIILHKINPKFEYDIIDIETRENVCNILDVNKYKCSNCGRKISSMEGLCYKCSRVSSSRVSKIKPPREDLKQMIRNDSFVNIGKTYNVSDNAVRKWCDSYGLPNKSREIKKISDSNWDTL